MIPQYSGTLATLSKEHPVMAKGLTTHSNVRGEPLSFVDKPFLIQLYTEGPKMDNWVIKKAVQTGVSEWAIQNMFHAAGWRGRIAAYILPTFGVRNRFVQNRINRLLLRVPAYRARSAGSEVAEAKAGAAGNLTLKRFGKGAILFLGSGTEADFIEFSADMMIVDELDRCEAANLELAADRLRESKHPQRLYISNPTLPRVGISKMYDETDRRRWYVRCGPCGERQPIDWFINIVEKNDYGRWILRDPENARPICRRCRRPFERVAEGAVWVPESPGEPVRGYHMSRMDVLSEDVAALFVEWTKAQGNPDKVKAFFRSVLGREYEFDGSGLTIAQLENALDPAHSMDPMGVACDYSKEVVTSGVDVGSLLNVNVSIVTRDDQENPVRRGVLVDAVSGFNDVADIFRRFKVNCAVVDVMPEIRKAQELRDTFVNEGTTDVWLCRFYPTPKVGAQKYGMRLDYRSHVVQVDRTSVFDVAYADIAGGKRTFPIDTMSVEAWADQMQAPVRVVDRAKQKISWTKTAAPDHYRLSDVYDRVAADLLESSGGYFVADD